MISTIEAAKLSEFGDFLSRTCQNIVNLVGCDYSEACQMVRAFKAELLDKFTAGLKGDDTKELET